MNEGLRGAGAFIRSSGAVGFEPARRQPRVGSGPWRPEAPRGAKRRAEGTPGPSLATERMKASAQRGPSYVHRVLWDSNQRGVSLGDRSESRAVADNGAMSIPPVTDPVDLAHLRRCVELAREGLDAGDEPFDSLLVDASGAVRFEDRNRVAGGDHTRHPEFEIAR